MSRRILVTGASGRLGRAVSDRLYRDGHDLLATDIVDAADLPYPFLRADLMDHAAAAELLEGVDVLMHIGNHPGLGSNPPQVVFNQNTTMNTNVFQAAAERGVRRIIFASTLQLIGSHVDSRTVVAAAPPPAFPLHGGTPARPTNLYALSKAVAEQMLQYYADRCGLECVALRLPMLHNCDGWASVHPGDETSIDIFEGFTGLTFSDAAALFEAVVRADLPNFRVFMAGTAHRHTQYDIATLIKKFYPQLPTDIPDLVDSSRLTRETGWEVRDTFSHSTSKDSSQ